VVGVASGVGLLPVFSFEQAVIRKLKLKAPIRPKQTAFKEGDLLDLVRNLKNFVNIILFTPLIFERIWKKAR
jgi:hypothetical protein